MSWFRKLSILYNEFLNRMNDNHISAYASSCAFFIFMSLIPVLMLVCAIIPYTSLTEDMLVFYLAELIPDMVMQVVKSIIYEVYEKSVALISVSAVGALWSAGKGILALYRGLNTIHNVKPDSYIVSRLKASLYTVIMLVAVVVSLMIIGFGQTVAKLIVSYIPQLNLLMDFLLEIRHVFSIVFLEIIFVIIFTWLPNKKVNWRYQIPGALVVGLGWIGFSSILSVYINQFAGFSMYGSVATIIVILLWLYTCMYMVLLGAMINEFLKPASKFLIRKISMRREEEDLDKEKGNSLDISAKNP